MSFHYSPNIVTEGLVLFYDPANTKSFVSGSTTIFDLTGGGYNGQLINGPVYSGTNYGTISLDAADDQINFANVGNITDGTVSVWFRNNLDITTGSTPSYPFLFSSGGTFSIFRAAYGNIAGATPELLTINLPNFVDNNTIAGRYYASSLPIVGSSIPSTWHNIVISRDGSGTRVYFDNVLLGAPNFGNNITTITTSTIPFSVNGFTNNRIGVNGNGLVSIFKIYNRALTTAEVNRNYQALKNRFGL